MLAGPAFVELCVQRRYSPAASGLNVTLRDCETSGRSCRKSFGQIGDSPLWLLSEKKCCFWPLGSGRGWRAQGPTATVSQSSRDAPPQTRLPTPPTRRRQRAHGRARARPSSGHCRARARAPPQGRSPRRVRADASPSLRAIEWAGAWVASTRGRLGGCVPGASAGGLLED